MFYNQHIRLGCDGNVVSKLDINNLPNKIIISYVGINELINFLKSEFGKELINQTNLNNINLVIYPTDSLCLSFDDYNSLAEYFSFLKRDNVKFYQSWYNEFVNFELYCGSHIHNALSLFINHFNDFSIDLEKKEKHFITLNNRWNSAREELFDFYINLNEFDKEKFYSSFNFKNIFLNNNGITDNFYSDDVIKYYQKSFIEIITESHFDSITEKSYKPLIAGIPFIYWGVDSRYGLKDFYQNQILYFKEIGINVNYFNINYLDSDSVREKIKEVLQLSKEELIEKYKEAFEMADNNKKIILNHLKQIEQTII